MRNDDHGTKKPLICILLVIGFIILPLSSVAENQPTFTTNPYPSETTILYVGGTGPNNYTSIQSAVDAASPGDTIYVYPGIYHGPIDITKSIQLIGEDKHTTIINANSYGVDINHIHGPGLTIENTENVLVSGFTIQNSKCDLKGLMIINSNHCTITGNILKNNSNAGIALEGSSYTMISDNIITNNTEFGIYIALCSDNTITRNIITYNEYGIYLDLWANNTLVSDNIIKNNHWNGLSMFFSYQNIIRNNSFTSDGIFIFGKDPGCWNSHIIENNLVNGKPVYYYAHETNRVIPDDAGQVILANCNNCIIEGLELSDTDGPIQLGYSSDISIVNNSITNTTLGIELTFSSNNMVSGNVVSNTMGGIDLWVCSNNEIRDNSVDDNYEGIRLTSTEYTIVSGNRITNNRCGILVGFLMGEIPSVPSSNNVYTHNVFSNNIEALLLGNADNDTATHNTFLDNGCGIMLSASEDNKIAYNTLTNGSTGIALQGARRNTIFGNTICGHNATGIRVGTIVGESTDNTIYHNNFMENNRNALDPYNNIWDDGYPSGGNYWDDYSGSDINHGPNQNISGSDGIGDAPYNISGGDCQDRYPLMKPWSDDEPPTICIIQPEAGYVYFSDNKVIKRLFSDIPVIIGKITISVNASDDSQIDHVDVYIDDVLSQNLASQPYSMIWDTISFSHHMIKVIAYDGSGNSASDEIEVFKML